MKIPKQTAELFLALGIEILQALREWNKNQETEFIELDLKGDDNAGKPEDIHRDD